MSEGTGLRAGSCCPQPAQPRHAVVPRLRHDAGALEHRLRGRVTVGEDLEEEWRWRPGARPSALALRELVPSRAEVRSHLSCWEVWPEVHVRSPLPRSVRVHRDTKAVAHSDVRTSTCTRCSSAIVRWSQASDGLRLAAARTSGLCRLGMLTEGDRAEDVGSEPLLSLLLLERLLPVSGGELEDARAWPRGQRRSSSSTR